MQVSIIGLGLIGASMGQALRAKHGDKITVVGYDSDQDAHNAAVKLGAVDRSEWNLDLAIRDADTVIIATPTNAIYDIFEACAPHFKSNALVIDTSSSKRAVTDWADELLPRNVDFVGIDPLTGAGFRGQKDAHYNLFQGKRVALTTTVTTRESAVKATVKLIEDIGGRPVFMDIDEHDSFAAAVNGLPLVTAACLLTVASTSPSWREISRFVDTNFQSVTEPASIDPALGHAMAVTNPDMMVHWMDELIKVLTSVRNGIADEEKRYDTDSPLADVFVNAWEQKLRLENGIEPGGAAENPIPTAGEMTMSIMLGRIGQQLMSRTRERSKDPTKYDRRKMR
jgi:prephenate dehydrogenase